MAHKAKGQAFNYDRAARCIVEAALYGFLGTADRNGITRQTLNNYHRRLANGDERLMQLVAKYKKAMTDQWATRLAPAILKAIDCIESSFAAIKADPNALINPDVLHAMTGAFKLIAEVQLTERMLDARLTESNRALPQAHESTVADEEGGEQTH